MAEIVKGTITVYPTRIIISPYLERNARIEYNYSIWDDVEHKYFFQAFIKDEVNNRLIIPTGFSVYELAHLFPTYEIVNKCNECEQLMQKLRRKTKIKMKYDFKDDIQRKAYAALIKKNSIKDKYKPMQKFLCLSTGKGKTYVATRYISENRERPIVFVDQESLALQWKERIMEYTETTEDEIFYISGTPSVNKLLKMDDKEINKIKFFICCYRTLTNNIKNNNGSDEISELFKKIKITLKIFDEAHVEYRSIFKIDMITNIRSLYLTATPKRSDPKEDKVYQRMFKNVEKISENLFVQTENYHNIIIYKWNSHPSIAEQTRCSTKYGFSMARYCSYLEYSKYDDFSNYITNILFNTVLANRKKKKVAILFGTIALLNKYYETLSKYIEANNFKLTVNKFNGQTKKDEKLKLLEETDIILTTDKSFDKGMDVKNLQVLINTVPFSSDTKLTQVIGRLRYIPDKEVIFIDINDIGFDAIVYQLRSKNEVYTEKAKNLFIKK